MEDLSQEPQEEEKDNGDGDAEAQVPRPSWGTPPAAPHTQTWGYSPRGIRLLWPTLEPLAITLLRS